MFMNSRPVVMAMAMANKNVIIMKRICNVFGIVTRLMLRIGSCLNNLLFRRWFFPFFPLFFFFFFGVYDMLV